MVIKIGDFTFKGEKMDDLKLNLPNIESIEELNNNRDRFFELIMEDLEAITKN